MCARDAAETDVLTNNPIIISTDKTCSIIKKDVNPRSASAPSDDSSSTKSVLTSDTRDSIENSTSIPETNVKLYSSLASDLDNNPGNIDNEGFVLQRSARARRRGKVVSGKSSSGNTFQGAPSTRHVFLFHVSDNVTTDTVSEHMKGKKLNYLSLKTMSNPAAMFKSFLITVTSEDFANIMNPEHWPPNSKLREFKMPQGGLRRSNNNGAKFS